MTFLSASSCVLVSPLGTLNFSSDISCVQVSPLDIHYSSSHLPLIVWFLLLVLISLRLIVPSSSFFSAP